MKLVGKHLDRELIYFDLESELEYLNRFNNWILLLICNSDLDERYISNVYKTCIKSGVLEFRSQGIRAEWLDVQFDITRADLEIEKPTDYNYDISTNSGDNSKNLESAIWECFYASVLPSRADWENIKIFCTTSDKADYSNKIQNIFNKIKSGWIPE